MSDNVRHLPVRWDNETAKENGYDGLVCKCGEAWFDLAVVADKSGLVNGNAIVGTCVSCKAEVDLRIARST